MLNFNGASHVMNRTQLQAYRDKLKEGTGKGDTVADQKYNKVNTALSTRQNGILAVDNEKFSLQVPVTRLKGGGNIFRKPHDDGTPEGRRRVEEWEEACRRYNNSITETNYRGDDYSKIQKDAKKQFDSDVRRIK